MKPSHMGGHVAHDKITSLLREEGMGVVDISGCSSTPSISPFLRGRIHYHNKRNVKKNLLVFSSLNRNFGFAEGTHARKNSRFSWFFPH